MIGHTRNECPGCRRTTAQRHARDCPISYGRILGEQAVYRAEYVDARHLREAVSLLRDVDDGWDRFIETDDMDEIVSVVAKVRAYLATGDGKP